MPNTISAECKHQWCRGLTHLQYIICKQSKRPIDIRLRIAFWHNDRNLTLLTNTENTIADTLCYLLIRKTIAVRDRINDKHFAWTCKAPERKSTKTMIEVIEHLVLNLEIFLYIYLILQRLSIIIKNLVCQLISGGLTHHLLCMFIENDYLCIVV